MQDASREPIPDKVIMYACIFTYEKPRVRTQILNYSFSDSPSIKQLSPEDGNRISKFVNLAPAQQRDFLDKREHDDDAKKTIKSLFQILHSITSD
mmetsp:Transcript_37560/g.49411  ORF Transcript_37560/g.49411 Transcript_37560/m.49411 type:complete len:95 (-) Transcript_37560:1317-1601(-)